MAAPYYEHHVLMDDFLPLPEAYSTHVMHYYQEPDQWAHMAIVPPIITANTFKQYGAADYKKYEYGRSGNPTRETMEMLVGKLDTCTYGLSFASGTGTVTTILGMLKSGDHFVCDNDVCSATNMLLTEIAANFGIEISFVDLANVNNLAKAMQTNTKMVWFETPTNPKLKVINIKAVSDMAHEKDRKILVVVDNTMMTSYLQRPMNFGADIVVYSLSQYVNGHSDVILGAISTEDVEIFEKLQHLQTVMGIVPSPFDCYQVLRGLKTLPVRMRQHSRNALYIARYLQTHPAVTSVNYPGLGDHPGFNVMRKQSSGPSGVISFYHKGGLEESKTFVQALDIFTTAEGYGGYGSMVEVPSVMTHKFLPKAKLEELKITDNLVRLSVGLEDFEDLVADLQRGLDRINKLFNV